MKEQGVTPAKSSEESNCCDSTAALTPVSQLTEHHQNSSPDNGSVANQQGSLFSQFVLLAGVSSASFGAIVVLWLPFPVLIALLTFLVSLSGMVYLCLQLFAREFRSVMQGRGIGDYLPASIYNQLTDLTLHEWMQDSSFTLEYRHLLLYFVPGITPERLEAYVDALAPTHRNNLRRRGLGHLLGEDFVRLVMGGERYRVHQLQNRPRPTELLLPSQADISIDAESDLDSNSPDAVIPIEIPRLSRGGPIIEDVAVSRTLFVEDDSQEQLQHEEAVLADAMMGMVNTYMSVSAETMTTGFVYVVERLTPYIMGTGLGITSIAAGIGMAGMWHGMHNPSGAMSRSSRFPSHRALWTTAFIGGLSAGGMLLFRSGVRTMFVRAPQSFKKKSESKKE